MRRHVSNSSYACILGLLGLSAWSPFAVAQTNRPGVRPSLLQTEAQPVRAAAMAEAQKVYDAWRQAHPSEAHVPREVMLKMYRAGDYKTLKTMIENGKISGEHSLSMADLRTALCLETIRDVCNTKIGGKRIKVYRSDSGNQSAGMTSDIDQTLFAYVEDEKGGWRRAPELDEHVTRLFKQRFEREHGITLDKFDIATFPGKDKFPDPRLVSVQVDAEGEGKLRVQQFSEKAGESMASLRLKPGAYTFCGAVVQQMQLRVLDQLHRELGAGHPAQAASSRKKHPEAQAIVGESDSRVCDEIGPDEKGEVKVKPATYEEAIDVMFDGLPPALERGHAYDAAVANYLEFMHHLHDENPAVKYHLRAADDGANMLHLLNELNAIGNAAEPRKARQQYEELGETERRAYLEKIVGKDNPAMVDRWKESFDLSAKLRELHNAKASSAENVDLAFKPLAEKLAPRGQEGRWQEFLPLARAEYNQRCQEFQLHNIIATSKERTMVWINSDPNEPLKRAEMDRLVDEDRIRKELNLEGPEHKMEWLNMKGKIYEQYADISRLQLLYSFREMDPKIVDTILATSKNKLNAADYQKLVNLRGEATAKLFMLWRVQEYPKLYRDYAVEFMKFKATEYKQNLLEHLLVQSGIKDPAAQMKVRDMFRVRRLPGIVSRYAHNAIFEVGNVDGVLKVLAAYSESGGDPEVYEKTVNEQVINALPIVGQVVGLYDADWAGRGMMAVCVAVPAAGMVVLVYSVGESGLALYEHEYVAPLANAASDAIYRGYVGPSLYEFGQAPPEFSDEDQKRLEEVAKTPDFAKAENQAQIKQWARLKIDKRMLEQKKRTWKTFVAESSRHEGGALWGVGGHLKQVKFPGDSLLDRVEQVVFFSPKGPVDFTLKPLTAEQQRRLEALPALIHAERDALAREDLIGEQETLSSQQEEFQRAERYRERAKENPELMLQIRRDSLWPYLLHDQSKDLVTAAWVRWWVDDRAKELPARLKGIGVDAGEKIPERVIEELQDRVEEDIQSSKARYERWQLLKQAQVKQQQELVERRKGAMMGEALMQAARERAKELGPLAEAIFLRNVPDSAPVVKIGLREIEGEKPGQEEYRADVHITANPGIYKPPYSAVTYLLTPEQAAQAAQSRNCNGIPLSDELVQALQRKAAGSASPSSARRDPAILTFAFCDGFELPQRTVPETIAALPRPAKVNVSLPDGSSKPLYLLGGSLCSGDEGVKCEIVSAEAKPEGGVFQIECKYRVNQPGRLQMVLIQKEKNDPTSEVVDESMSTNALEVCAHVFHQLYPDPSGAPRTYFIQVTSSATGTNILARSEDVVIQTVPEGWVFEGLHFLSGQATSTREVGGSVVTIAATPHGSSLCVQVKETDKKTGACVDEKVEWVGPLPAFVRKSSTALGWKWVESRKESEPAKRPTKPVLHGDWISHISLEPVKGKMDYLTCAWYTLKDNTQPEELSRKYNLPRINPRRNKDWEAPPNAYEAELVELFADGRDCPLDHQTIVAHIFGGAYAREEVAAFEWSYRKGQGNAPPKPPATTPARVAPPDVPAQPITVARLPATSILSTANSAPSPVQTLQPSGGNMPRPADLVPVRAAAEKGDVASQHQLGVALYEGQGVVVDYKSAVQWFRKSGEKGNTQSQNYLGRCYENGRGVARDLAEALRWYTKSAEGGYPGAQYNLARMHYFGKGVPKDAREAFRWYRKGAEQGHAPSQNALGTLLDNGEGTTQNYQEALKWYRLAADQGYTDALCNLGVMYANGHGVPKNISEAVRWYRLAANAGAANAQDYLGRHLESGDGVPKDLQEAARWYRMAAEQGLGEGQFHLGLLFTDGRGVPRDLIQAHKWFDLAAAQAWEEANQRRNQVAAQMSPQQIAEAQRLAGEWKPTEISNPVTTPAALSKR